MDTQAEFTNSAVHSGTLCSASEAESLDSASPLQAILGNGQFNDWRGCSNCFGSSFPSFSMVSAEEKKQKTFNTISRR